VVQRPGGRRRRSGRTTASRAGAWRAAAVGAGLLLAPLAGCTADPTAPDQARQAAPPAPPAACLLDVPTLGTATGVGWTPDQSTATDTRCVYDPAGAADHGQFLAVDLEPATGVAASTELDTVAGVCDPGSRVALTRSDTGFVCRYQAGNVFAALVRNGKLITVATSAVPPGTTGARLVVALDAQLSALGTSG
jgi:hypothetical protein